MKSAGCQHICTACQEHACNDADSRIAGAEVVTRVAKEGRTLGGEGFALLEEAAEGREAGAGADHDDGRGRVGR